MTALSAPLVAAVARIAARRQILVCCDFDGTLAPIVAQPSAARALPGASDVLGELADLPGTVVAVVSGRARSDLARLAATPSSVVLVGSHGTEFDEDFAASLTPAQRELRERLQRELADLVAEVPGAAAEEKLASIAVHVRNADPDLGAALLAAVEAGPGQLPGVHLTHGKAVVELAVVIADKGSAVSLLRERSGAQAVFFVGDDVTDERAFQVLTAGDVGVKVGTGETAAEFRVADPAEVLALLRELAARRSGAQLG